MERELKKPITPSAHVFENLTVKSEDNIERSHQVGKRSEILYCGLTNFQKYQIYN